MNKRLLVDALKIAYKHLPNHNQFNCYPHYSFVIQDNQLIEWGTNLTGDPPIYFGYNKKSAVPKLHSELVAYRKARGLLLSSPFQLINIRLNKKGEWKTSTPCFICQTWLASVGCTTVWSTLSSGQWEKVKL